MFGVSNIRIGFEALGVGITASTIAIILYRLWDASLQRPATYLNGDLNQTEMVVKTIIQTGWFNHQPRLGAPFGQLNYDFPLSGETLQMIIIRIMAMFTSSSGLIINVYFFGGFGAVAVTVFLVLRHLRFGPLISAAVALPYAFLSFRLYHNEAHLFRTTYLSVPLAVLLMLWLAGWRQRFLRDPTDPSRIDWRTNLRWKRVAAAAAICLFIGSWETMTTAFSLTLLAVATLFGAVRWHDWRRLIVGLAAITLIGVSFAVSSLPSLLYWHSHGANAVAGKRIVAEAELYGLKINRLILPSDGSRLRFMQIIANESQDHTPVPSEGGQSLGVLFTLGLFGALYAAVAGVRRTRITGPDQRRPEDREALRETVGFAVVTALFVATVGGFSTVLGLLGLAQIRVWNRISLFIAFFALLQVVIWGERLTQWARRRFHWSAPVLALGAVMVCALALSDGPSIRHPDYQAIRRQSVTDRQIVTQIEHVMPPGAKVMQLPAFAYPESPAPGKMRDYDPLRPFLADKTGELQWSYAGIVGRPQVDWQKKLKTGASIVRDLPALLGMGFTGLWVDTFGYSADRATPIAIQQALQETPITSLDGRFRFYDLRPYSARLGLTKAELRAIAISALGITPPN